MEVIGITFEKQVEIVINRVMFIGSYEVNWKYMI